MSATPDASAEGREIARPTGLIESEPNIATPNASQEMFR